jgi:hypothetical protein
MNTTKQASMIPRILAAIAKLKGPLLATGRAARTGGKALTGGAAATGKYVLEHPGATIGAAALGGGAHYAYNTAPGHARSTGDAIVAAANNQISGASAELARYTGGTGWKGLPLGYARHMLGLKGTDRRDVWATRLLTGMLVGVPVAAAISDERGRKSVGHIAPMSESLARLAGIEGHTKLEDEPEERKQSMFGIGASAPYSETRDITTQDPDEYNEFQRRRALARILAVTATGSMIGAAVGAIASKSDTRMRGAAFGSVAGAGLGALTEFGNREALNYLGYPLQT